jgi:hypothetical protein
VDCNRAVLSTDAQLIVQLSAGLIAGLPCAANGDINHDGETNSIDALLILQYVAGLIHSFPT